MKLSNPLFEWKTDLEYDDTTATTIMKTAIKNHFEQIDAHMENELRKIGFVRLKPGQVVAEYKTTEYCPLGGFPEHDTTELVEVKP